ncbi:DUF2972 domain-containing protein, partial [Campylobacter sp. TTU_617]|uniref:DUF2972 domain-containing protein n=1 Tax=Campylobacter sp. TTU_617 TaxID=2768148 RepID=UPI0019067591
LDSNKLKDINEELNYHTIDANLAWDLNLPLPDNYEFMWFFNSCSGSNAMYKFFEYCNIKALAHPALTGKVMYKDMYHYIRDSEYSIAVVPPIMQNFYNGQFHMNKKLLHLYFKHTDIVFIVRDPISICKTALNHIHNFKVYNSISFEMKNVNLNENKNYVFPKLYYAYSENKPNVKDLDKVLNNNEFYFTVSKRINFFKKVTKNIRCIEFSQIGFDNAYNTFLNLSKYYNFVVPKDESVFKNRVDRDNGNLIVLPVELYFDYKDHKTTFLVATKQLIISNSKYSQLRDITFDIINWNLTYNNIVILVNNFDFNFLKQNSKIKDTCRDKIKQYIQALELNENQRIENSLNEEQILEYLKEQKDLRNRLKNLIDDNLAYVKENHPEYIEKWKYYKEFEKMCEELDGGS